jgi:hypothetical protein
MERGDGKELSIRTPDSDFRITVDNDDVDQSVSVPLIERMLAILNDHWEDAVYAHLKPMDREDGDLDGERAYEAAQKRLKLLLKN